MQIKAILMDNITFITPQLANENAGFEHKYMPYYVNSVLWKKLFFEISPLVPEYGPCSSLCHEPQ